MALTFTQVDAYVVGDREHRIYDVAFDGAYPVGGEVVTADNFGLRNRITHIEDTVTTGGYIVHFVPATSALKVFEVGAAGPLDEADAADLGSATARLTVIGR